MDDIHARLARNLRLLRQKKGLSQEELADEAGLHRTYLSHLETGKRNPGLEIIDRLSRALGVTAGKLLD